MARRNVAQAKNGLRVLAGEDETPREAYERCRDEGTVASDVRVVAIPSPADERFAADVALRLASGC